jgi:hypothetical protein
VKNLSETKEVIAKFRLDYVRTDNSKNPEHPIMYDLEFSPVIDGSEENKQFFQYTPWGRINLGTLNEQAAAFFLDASKSMMERGDIKTREFYVIFRKA